MYAILCTYNIYARRSLLPSASSRWVKFLEELFGNKFSLLLWAGAVLCFIGYSVQAVRKTSKKALRYPANLAWMNIHPPLRDRILPFVVGHARCCCC